MPTTIRSALAVLVLSAAVAPSGASAADAARSYSVNAAGACNGALPSFEGALRKRPLAIRNEGATSVFVTCSVPGDYLASGNGLVVAAFTNGSTSSVTVNCTMVDGRASPWGMFDEGDPEYYPQSKPIHPGGVAALTWTPTSGTFSAYANVNCLLPPDVEINLVEVTYVENVGA